nr:uncharacterized protein LOC106622917 [Bactrocera oleae]
MHCGIFWLCAGLLLLAGGQLTEAGTSTAIYHDDAHPGKCTLGEKDILSPGETTITANICARISCENEEGLVGLVGCIPQVPKEGCVWGIAKDRRAPYPECCERYQICS